jgi:hypothetical protein
MQRGYGYMAGGLALTGIVAYAAAASGFYQAIAATPLIWLVMLAPLGFVLVLSFGIQRMSADTAMVLFWLYAAVMGLSLGSIFLVFTGESIARVFFITAATYAVMSLYGYTTKSDLSRFGSFLMMGLIGIVIASLVNIFVGSSALQFAISIIRVIVFVGLARTTPSASRRCIWSPTALISPARRPFARRAVALSRFHKSLHDLPFNCSVSAATIDGRPEIDCDGACSDRPRPCDPGGRPALALFEPARTGTAAR